MKGPTYAATYNSMYTSKSISKWIDLRIKRTRGLTRRFVFTTHLLKIMSTQCICSRIDSANKERVNNMRRLCVIGAILRLRQLQIIVLKRVWRPGGNLYTKHIPYDIVSEPSRSDTKLGGLSPPRRREI